MNKKMEKDYEKDYSLITGLTNFEQYTNPEDQANKIEKCSILLPINITFSDRVIETEKSNR